MKSSHLSAYFQFFELKREIEQAINVNPCLDANEMCLLEHIAVKDAADEALTVVEVMRTSDIGSPATLHRRLRKLRQHGLVEVRSVAGDKRVKHLHLTSASKNYFDLLNDAVLKVLN
jgi:DNA-binding MarR family transcriptional regulator